MQRWTEIGDLNSSILIIGDHASAVVPPGIDLGIDPDLLGTHIAVDLGVAQLASALCVRLGCGAILGAASRLVVDLNRDLDDPAVIPVTSDGKAIPGNRLTPADRQKRLNQWWHPYHDQVSQMIASHPVALMVSLHSFTPQLSTSPSEARPWDIGILYNEDDRAARIAIPMLEAKGVCVGDQLPYSGKILNATMNRHGEANGIGYLGIEMRQDRIANSTDVAHWADMLAAIILPCAKSLSSQ
jgi:predicted N-formylglutamate amidohydrolase